MVNEVALIMLWGMFGWQIAAIYIATGLTVALVGGLVIGKLKPVLTTVGPTMSLVIGKRFWLEISTVIVRNKFPKGC